MTLYARQQKRQMWRTDFWTLWEKVRVGWFERIALKHVYYHMWNRLPVQVRCMRQGTQARCTGMTLRDGMGREVGSGWGTHVHPWVIYVNVWQKPLQYCNVISLQLNNFFKRNKLSSLLWITSRREAFTCTQETNGWLILGQTGKDSLNVGRNKMTKRIYQGPGGYSRKLKLYTDHLSLSLGSDLGNLFYLFKGLFPCI